MPSQKINQLRYPNVFYFFLSSAFMFGFSMWIIAFYLNVSEISYISDINYGLRLVITFFLLYYSVAITLSDRDRVKNISILLSIPFLYLLAFLSSFVNFGFDLETKAVVGQFILNGLATWTVGFLCYRYNLGLSLLLFIEKFSFLIFPAIVFFIFRILFLNTEVSYVDLHKLGQIDYLYLGYSLLPLFLSSSLLLFFKGGGAFNYRWVLIFGNLIAIILSQARGAALGAFIFLVIIFVIGIYDRKKILPILLLSLLTFSLHSTLLGSNPSRYKMIDESLKIYSKNENFDFTNFYRLSTFSFLKDYGHGIVVDPVTRTCFLNNKEIAHQISTNNDFYKKLSDGDCKIKLSRMSLLTISINEITKNPLVGMGPLGFKVKYFGHHPHNVILELLVELGVILGGFVIVFLSYVFFVFFMRIKNLNPSSQIAFFFGIAFMPMLMLSESIWTNSIFLFLTAYSIMFLSDRKIAAE